MPAAQSAHRRLLSSHHSLFCTLKTCPLSARRTETPSSAWLPPSQLTAPASLPQPAQLTRPLVPCSTCRPACNLLLFPAI